MQALEAHATPFAHGPPRGAVRGGSASFRRRPSSKRDTSRHSALARLTGPSTKIAGLGGSFDKQLVQAVNIVASRNHAAAIDERGSQSRYTRTEELAPIAVTVDRWEGGSFGRDGPVHRTA